MLHHFGQKDNHLYSTAYYKVCGYSVTIQTGILVCLSLQTILYKYQVHFIMSSTVQVVVLLYKMMQHFIALPTTTADQHGVVTGYPLYEIKYHQLV